LIGLAGQNAAIDENLTGRENIEMVGRLYHLGRREALRRADVLLESFGLQDAAKRLAKTYSGGMRRRLDLAATLVARPQVLFLDEPTTGLDPRSRLDLWGTIRGLVDEGVTVLLTTQYLEEADHLADVISIIDNGKVITTGTPEELKARVGGQVLVLTPSDETKIDTLTQALDPFSTETPTPNRETGEVVLSISGGAERLPEVMRRVESVGVVLADLTCRRPTLDDVFLNLTGHSAEDAGNHNPNRGTA
jgi:ABC-2 type transport system ATP-binding protein